jgi:hypothetical protein
MTAERTRNPPRIPPTIPPMAPEERDELELTGALCVDVEELAVDVELLNEVTAVAVGVMTSTDVIVGLCVVVTVVIGTVGCVVVAGGLVCGIAGRLRLLSALKEG